jgi:hypothetical protein
MPSAPTNDAILAAMRRALAPAAPMAKADQADVAPCTGFGVDNFGVTYPNNELMAVVEVTQVPPGVTLLGVTVAASPGPASQQTHCMGVSYDSNGVSLPVSVLGASTSPAFSTPTKVMGTVVLAYTSDGATIEQCTITRTFTVGS